MGKGNEAVKIFLFLIVLAAASFAAAQGVAGQSPNPTRKEDEKILQQQTFSPAVADVLVARVGEGLAGHNRKTLLSAFDKSDPEDYAAIEEQINAIMEAYRAFKVFYRVESSTLNPDGTATIRANFQVEQQPAAENTVPFRRESEFTLTAARTKNGWRVTSFSPLNFFIATE
jgi:hypothetical protein